MFRTDGWVLSGDVAFAGSVGRSDFELDRQRCSGASGGSSSSPTASTCCPDTVPGPRSSASARRTRSCRTSERGAPAAAGTVDLLPADSEAMLGLYDAAHRIARLYGSRYAETPTFEHTELFARTSGETSDVVTKEMYTFEDKGGARSRSGPSRPRAWFARTSRTRRSRRRRSRRTTSRRSSATGDRRRGGSGSSASSASRRSAWPGRPRTSRSSRWGTGTFADAASRTWRSA